MILTASHPHYRQLKEVLAKHHKFCFKLVLALAESRKEDESPLGGLDARCPGFAVEIQEHFAKSFNVVGSCRKKTDRVTIARFFEYGVIKFLAADPFVLTENHRDHEKI